MARDRLEKWKWPQIIPSSTGQSDTATVSSQGKGGRYDNILQRSATTLRKTHATLARNSDVERSQRIQLQVLHHSGCSEFGVIKKATQKVIEIQGPHSAENVELGTKDDEDRDGVADDAIEGTQPRVPRKKILHWKGHWVLIICGVASLPHPIPADYMNCESD